MPAIAADLTGQKFGYLTVKRRVPGPAGRPRWECRCECGTLVQKQADDLRKAVTTSSCGCHKHDAVKQANTTHGMTQHPVWQAWASMRARCSNHRHQFWHRYGGRGIKVCKRWEVFENFWLDMGGTWRKGLSLGRINNQRGYSPANCRWETQQQQLSNTCVTRLVSTPKGKMPMSEAARLFGIKLTTLKYRLDKGWKGDKLWSTTSRTQGRATGSRSKDQTGKR